MFCSKCGYDAQNAKFCPKCGNPIKITQPQQETVTPQQSVQPQGTVQSQQTGAQSQQFGAQPQQFGTQPQQTGTQPQQFGAQPQQFGTQPQQTGAQPQQFGTQPQQFGTQPQMGMPQPQSQPEMPKAKKKKKKWPIVLVCVLAGIILLGVAGYFAYPYIDEMLHPKKQAITALKNAGADFESCINDSIDKFTTTGISDKQEMKGSFKIGSANIDGSNYLSYLKVDTVNYDIQTSLSSNEISGTVSLASGSSKPVVQATFYTDNSYLYFNIPEISSTSFRVSLSYLGVSTYGSSVYRAGSSVSGLGSLNSSTVSLYADVFKAVVSDIMGAFDNIVDSCEYNKVESTTYKSDNGDIKVNVFEVTVNQKALEAGIDSAIDNIYGDSKLTSYLSLLSIYGMNKDTLKSEAKKEISGMQPVKFKIYVNKDNKIVKATVDASEFGEDSGEVSASFIGKDNLYDYVVFEIKDVENASAKFVVKKDSDDVSFSMDITPDQTQYKGEYISAGIDMSVSGTNVTIKNVYVKGKADKDTIDVSGSGQYALSNFSSMTYGKTYFGNTIEINDKFLSTPGINVVEYYNNINKIAQQLLSDSLYNQYFKSLNSQMMIQ